jgi:transcriptional regulator NrdR family protein
MICPICKSGTLVVDSRSDNENVYRRRRCRSCDHRFTTTESISDNEGLKNVRREIKNFQVKKSLMFKKR